MPRQSKQMEIVPTVQEFYTATFTYKVDEQDVETNVKHQTMVNILELKRIFKAHKILIEKEN